MVELDEYIVMPNHIHGIVIIHSDNVGTGNDKNNDLFGIKNGSVENNDVQGVADVGSGGHDVGSGGHDVGSGVVVVVETLHATSLRSQQSTSPPSTSPPSTLQQSTSSPPSTSSPQSTQSTTTPPAVPQQTGKNQIMADISPKPGSLSVIVRSYKSAVTKHAHRLGFQFAWQPRFHDHIIRNQDEFERIRQYIINNPKNWNNDKFYQL